MEKINTADKLLFVFTEREPTAHDSAVAREAANRDESAQAALVCLAQSGDREAFGRLYERFGAMVHGILLARVPYAEVDDLTQEVFLIAFRQLEALRNPRTFGGWLAAITRNCAYDFHRRTRIAEMLTDESASCNSLRAEALEILRVLQTLPEAYRETLVLRLIEGMSGAEIAARTGLTPASVRVNLHRGMRQLRERLQNKDEVR